MIQGSQAMAGFTVDKSVLELHLMGAFNRTKAKHAEVEAKVNANRCLCDGIEIDGVQVPCNRPPRSRVCVATSGHLLLRDVEAADVGDAGQVRSSSST